MKKLETIFIITILTLPAFAQDFSTLKEIPLKDSMQCKDAEPRVLECANYLLSTPYSEDSKSVNATQFIMAWMEHTPNYSFGLSDKLFKSIQSDQVLVSRYMASQSKIAINDKPKDSDSEFQLKFTTIFLDYCENPKMNVKPPAKVKKLIEAHHNGTLKELL